MHSRQLIPLRSSFSMSHDYYTNDIHYSGSTLQHHWSSVWIGFAWQRNDSHCNHQNTKSMSLTNLIFTLFDHSHITVAPGWRSRIYTKGSGGEDACASVRGHMSILKWLVWSDSAKPFLKGFVVTDMYLLHLYLTHSFSEFCESNSVCHTVYEVHVTYIVNIRKYVLSVGSKELLQC